MTRQQTVVITYFPLIRSNRSDSRSRLKHGQYVRVVGSLVTDSAPLSHGPLSDMSMAQVLPFLANARRAKTRSRERCGVEVLTASDHNPAHPARYNEIHPPDRIEPLDEPLAHQRETVRRRCPCRTRATMADWPRDGRLLALPTTLETVFDGAPLGARARRARDEHQNHQGGQRQQDRRQDRCTNRPRPRAHQRGRGGLEKPHRVPPRLVTRASSRGSTESSGTRWAHPPANRRATGELSRPCTRTQGAPCTPTLSTTLTLTAQNSSR